jgi:hypothetical protein
MVIIKELYYVNLDDLSKILAGIGIENLNIFSIDNKLETNIFNSVNTDKGSKIIYTEMNTLNFIKFLNFNGKFLEYNKDSFYILRDGNFLDIKNIFASINNCQVNVGRGGSQKAHMLSPLDLRLTSYLLAMFNFDYKLINNLNTFNHISKDRYLSYMDKSYKYVSIFKNKDINKEFKSIGCNSESNKEINERRSIIDYLK